MKKSQSATREEVAKEAGVSTFTVSQALRGQAGVAAETRARVEAAAARLGYAINPAASFLARQRSPSGVKRQWAVGYLGGRASTSPDFLKACKEFNLEGNYLPWEEIQSPEATAQMLWNRGISGLLINTADLRWSEEERARFDWSRFSVVKQARTLPDLRCHLVEHNAFDYMSETLRQVVARGYRRLAVILLNTGTDEDEDARYGALMNFHARKLPPGVTCVWREADGGDASHLDARTLEWLREQNPDVIVAYHWVMIFPLRKAGFRIPEEFPMAAVLSDTQRLPGIPIVSGCDTQAMAMMRRSLMILQELIGRGEHGLEWQPVEHMVEPTWIEGETLAGKAGSSSEVQSPA